MNLIQDLADLIDVAKGSKPADLLITNATIINVFNETFEKANIAIKNGVIAGVGDYLEGKEIIDAGNAFVAPSFIDSHMHIESTMLIPGELAKILAPLGTTTVVADPHEIANVAGIPGIQFMISASRNLPVDFYFLAPSCVPATRFETSGASLYADDLEILLSNKRILGLAEMMNFPGVLSKDEDVLEKLESFNGRIIDGHSPGLSGKNLSAYLSSGVMADHECTDINEAFEKLSRGMFVMIREGSVTRDLKNLLGLITDRTKHRILLCTDDKHPEDLISEGHINYSIKLLIENGVDLPVAVRLATLNPAMFFGLRQRGGIAPGYLANLNVFRDPARIEIVIKNGKVIARNGKPEFELEASFHDDAVKNTINLRQVTFENMQLKQAGSKIRVISVKEGSVVTDELILTPKTENGLVVSDTERDIIKIGVFERHRASGRYSLGFIHGLGLKSGAFATSVAHDSHNIIVAGANDRDMLLAIAQIEAMGGGIAITKQQKVIGSLALPYGGLMTNKSVYEVAESLKELHRVAKEENGVTAKDPFMTLAFMALPVIPSLKLTDRGLVDVNKFSFVSLFIE